MSRSEPFVMKRKRKSHSGLARNVKRVKVEHAPPQTTSKVDHPVLRSFYANISTLRTYLLSQLPPASRNRRRALNKIGIKRESSKPETDLEHHQRLGELLDGTLVAVREPFDRRDDESRLKDLQHFSQQLSASTGSGRTLSKVHSHPEVSCRYRAPESFSDVRSADDLLKKVVTRFQIKI